MHGKPSEAGDWGRLLRNHRLRAGMSQEDLARVSGLSVRGIRMIETSRRHPRASTVRILAESLGLSDDESMALLEAVHPDARTSPGGAETAVPRQLPSPPRGFTGREDVLSIMDEEAAREPNLLWAITGPGGVGKTWLPVRWANDNAERFPDGQLYVNLRGFDPDAEPVPPQAGLRNMVAALGVPSASIPSDLDELAALYRTVTAGKRLIVVLDNAHDAAQVIPLLPGGPTNTVIVTSRDNLNDLVTSHGAQRRRLDSFTEETSRRLLVDRLGKRRLDRERPAVQSLVDTCGGLPIALSIVAARAAQYPDHPLSAVVDELGPTDAEASNPDGIATGLRAIFESTRRWLGDEASTMFDLLGLGPGNGVDAWAAASLLGQPVSRARKALRELEDVNLIEQDAPGHYRMHDLTYAYASGRARSAPSEEALRRVIDHYVATGFAASRALQTGTGDRTVDVVRGCVPAPMAGRPEALAWYGREAANLPRFQEIALRYGWCEAAWQLAASVELFGMERASSLTIDQALWSGASAAAERLEPMHRIRAQRQLATCLSDIPERHPEAIDLLREVIDQAMSAGEATECAGAHFALALLLDSTGRHEEAHQQASRALVHVSEAGSPLQRANVHNLMCAVLTHLERHDDAEREGRAALRIAREEDLRFLEATVLNDLAANAQGAGRCDEAVELFSNAQTLYDELEPNRWVQDNLDHLGDALHSVGRQEEAVTAWTRAADLMEREFRVKDAERVRAKLAG